MSKSPEKFSLYGRGPKRFSLYKFEKLSHSLCVVFSDSTGTEGESEVCKICMDAMIDCVLLECGHMVTCTTCGRRLNECPICRNFVVRVVHTFKA